MTSSRPSSPVPLTYGLAGPSNLHPSKGRKTGLKSRSTQLLALRFGWVVLVIWFEVGEVSSIWFKRKPRSNQSTAVLPIVVNMQISRQSTQSHTPNEERCTDACRPDSRPSRSTSSIVLLARLKTVGQYPPTGDGRAIHAQVVECSHAFRPNRCCDHVGRHA
jgi:hypothetical protein